MTNDIILKFNRISQVKFFNDSILHGLKIGANTFKITILDDGVFSNVCAPVAGVIEHYQKQGVEFIIDDHSSDFAKKTHFDNPLIVSENKTVLDKPFNKVWRFENTDDISDLVNNYLLSIRKADAIEQGITDAIEWSLNEVMDNVLQHSKAEHGFVMGQIYPASKKLSFCIFDTGIGIFNSFKESKLHSPHTPYDALIIAMNENVTRDTNIGQGNELWGFSRIIAQAKGMFSIGSNGAKYVNNNGIITPIRAHDFNLGQTNGTTLIDFQFDYNEKIDVVSALNGYKPTDLWIESIECDDDTWCEIKVVECVKSVGTRRSAIELRNMILNIINCEKKRIVINFDGLNILSSSFADELIGKIIALYGFVFFTQMFRIENLNPTATAIVNRSVEQRMAQIYLGKEIEETDE